MIPTPRNERIRITIPWPITVNHYWVVRSKRRFLSREALAFREEIALLARPYLYWFGDSRLSMHIDCYPPDKRKRDLDNLLKSTLDALQHARVFNDDNQIDRLSIWRHNDSTVKEGCAVVTITVC